MNSVMAQQQADSQHPWIGLASFTEGDREFFAGRGEEIEQLRRLVRRDTLTLLYGVSGLGKTSLLQAGLFPVLREEHYLPVHIKLDYLESADPLAKQLIEAVTAAAAETKVDAPQPRPGETLWEYFHRVDNHFWSPRNDLVTPFLAFDQFEEFFTLGRETADRTRRGLEFITELADLVENRPPAALRDESSRAKEFTFKPVPLNVLLSMREDYLGDLDYIRSRFRALAQNRMRLRPMGEEQARDVIALGTSLLAPGAEDRIVKYVAGASANGDGAEMTVAPALLSLVLSQLNERRLSRGQDAKITADLLDVEQEKILDDFYCRTLKDFPGSVRTFVEDELLTASGHRNSCALDDALTKPGVTQPVLNELVNRRLLAYEDRNRIRRVELTHDVLIPVIKASRDTRRTNEALAQAERLRLEQAAQKWKQRLTAGLAGALAIALLATLLGGYYAFVQEHEEYYREFAKRNGFPVGIMRISRSEAGKLPVSFRLMHKGTVGGIVFDGWKLHWKPIHWKPPFRVEAVNGLLELTTNHSVYPYLWKGELESEGAQDTKPGEKGELLGLKTVCQWEFVSTREGEIIYERALDRAGRMVYGLIYSPPGSGVRGTGERFSRSAELLDSRKVETSRVVPSTRLARFVGPDGFPLLLRRSAAEYVQIHYDKNGWEDRVMYRDGKGLPAAGPDSAFGQSMQHESSGRLMCVLSLNVDGRPMVDDAGNSGMQLKYDKRGFDIEDTSVGTKQEPMPVKDGWFTCKNQYDEFGRLCRAAYYGVNGEPVVSSKKDGYHALKEEYDEHGDETVETYIDTGGKPMALADGYATVKMAYNSHGKLTLMRFYGVNGEPVLSEKNGYHGWKAEYDERGNETVETYIDTKDKPMAIPDDHYATVKMAYDTSGNVIRKTFYAANGDPVLSKKNGYHGWEKEYDEHGNQTVITFLGLDDKPMRIADGYATVKSAYDAHGELTLVRCYGVDGEPVLSKENGYHGFKAEYDEHGNQTVETYLGLKGKPTTIADGYATVKWTYDARGKLTRQTFYGVNDEPVLSKKNGYHGWEKEYDEHGHQTVITFLGLDDKPMRIADGYATVKSAYDARGKEIGETFYDDVGTPARSKSKGNHGWEENDHGKWILRTYIGPTLTADGYATVLTEYGKMTRQTFYGVNGEPVQHKEGYYGREAEYDEQGNPTVETYLGLDGKPMSLADGYATVKSTYDALGNETRRTFYDVNGEPVQHKEGYYGREAEYDENGKVTAMTYIDKDGKPMSLADGYATMKSIYDSRGNETQRTFYDVNGEPVHSKEDGCYGRAAEYDEHGNKTVQTCLGKDGKPTLDADGYATFKSTYDARGELTGQRYYGVNGEPLLSKEDGCHGWEAENDEHGNPIVMSFLGLDGKPMTIADGYATVKSIYDSRGNVIEVRLYGANGEPVLSKKKHYHGFKAEYDEQGNRTVTTYLGKNGKPIALPAH